MVSSDQEEASRAGAEVLAAGGNAVDAAAATALALGVVNPSSSGVGGGGFAIVYIAAERTLYALDFREVAPAALGPDDFVVDGKVDPSRSRTGGLAVGVPGEPAGLFELNRRFGALPWKAVVEPARALADRGFVASWYLAKVAARMLAALPGSPLARWLTPGGTTLTEGRALRRSGLAATLAALAADGPRGFYRGWVADDLIATIQASGGVMTHADLEAYQVVEREPLVGSFRGYRIATMPLPSSGGIALLEMFGLLDASGTDLAALGVGSSAALHVIAEVLKHAFADRARSLGDTADAAAMARVLLAPARLARLATRIAPDRVQPHARYGEAVGPATPARGSGTSHLCAIDAAGNAVALTTTVNGYFGAKLVAPRSGVVLNNEIDDFTIEIGAPNMFGLVQSEANLVGPGKRPLSSMTPTLVLEGDRVVGCAGGSGGPRIISGTFQTLLNAIVFGLDARAAVEQPRVHHQWLPDTLYVEREVPRDVVDGLARRGQPVKEEPDMAAVQIVWTRGGVRQAASDPRKGGAPAAEPAR